METKEKLRTDLRKSAYFEPFANWEAHDFKCFVKSHALVPDTYFMVGIIADKRKRSGDFVASKIHFYIQNCDNTHRRYRKIVLDATNPHEEKDVVLVKGRVYHALDRVNCELIFVENEWKEAEKVAALFEKMCGEKVPEVQRYVFDCQRDGGYFLAGETYEVWASQLADGRVLVCDYNVGLPWCFAGACGTLKRI